MNGAAFLITLVAVVGCLGLVVWRAKRALTMFVLIVEDGRIVRLKGRIPRRLLGDISDVIRLERIGSARIYCRIEYGAAAVRCYGDTNPGLEQSLRNLVGSYPVTRLKQAPKAQS